MDKAMGSLSDYIMIKGGKLPEEECREIMRQLMEGLKYLHLSNIVHRDMKPGNILMMSFDDLKDSVKITDFSISAKLTDAMPYELVDTAGTLLYKAPEQFSASPCTTYTDMWPVGIILYETLTGEHPYFGANDDPSSFVGKVMDPRYRPEVNLPGYCEESDDNV